ncbi:hypothetical protein F3Y22_tig00110332pilonHSYRG00484 [Hibiscus syriacus]|uniref:LysM domain-containing protein n=1 Tax=Hibiscus syriacus TaxID=106335 RepID=A0A6A3AWB3_HIBSY|nr:hypothetical protein F3Y22_tig00110332pilonHSYRG00484 [Hibiscus syriacus]
MAKPNNKTSMLTNLVLIAAVFVLVSMAESRGLVISRKSTPSCVKVYGVESGDTCFSVTQTFNMTDTFFYSVNPNLNCDSLFVGQWLCIAGTA